MSVWQPIQSLDPYKVLLSTSIILWNPCDGVHLLRMTASRDEIEEIRTGTIFTHWQQVEPPHVIPKLQVVT